MQQSPRAAGAPDVAQASEVATPGASVKAQHLSVLDHETPGPPSPGQASPARHRSQEGQSADAAAVDRSASRGRGSASFDVAQAAAPPAAGAVDAAAAAAEPLTKPRLRVQGADIILEDAASPKAAADDSSKQQLAEAAAAAATGQQPAASQGVQPQAAAGVGAAQQQQQPQQHNHHQHHPAPQQHHLVAAARASQSHEHELQLRLASRTATGHSNMAIASSRQAGPQLQQMSAPGDDRQRHDGGGAGGAAAELGPGSSSTAAVEAPVRMKYRSTLTEENVAYLNKLDQYSSRPDSSERIWRWLEGSGPPFDNPPPSLGVPTVSKSTLAAASKRQTGKQGFFSCFGCFGGR